MNGLFLRLTAVKKKAFDNSHWVGQPMFPLVWSIIQPVNRLTERQTNQPTNRPTEWPTDRLNHRPTDRPCDWETDQRTDRLADQPTTNAESLTHRPMDRQTTDRVSDRLTDRPTEKPTVASLKWSRSFLPIVGGYTCNSMAFEESTHPSHPGQDMLQLYVPSSLSVTFIMVKMKAFLHLLSVVFNCILYFSVAFSGSDLLWKYHLRWQSFHFTLSVLTKHFRLVLVKAAASFFADSVSRLLSAEPVFRTISIVNVFIEKSKYSQLPLLRTPSGRRVSVLNSESP